MTRSELETLRADSIAAHNAYYAYRTDGTVDGDLERLRLCKEHVRTEDKYKAALDAFLKESEAA